MGGVCDCEWRAELRRGGPFQRREVQIRGLKEDEVSCIRDRPARMRVKPIAISRDNRRWRAAEETP
jgi:hypothetical protein